MPYGEKTMGPHQPTDSLWIRDLATEWVEVISHVDGGETPWHGWGEERRGALWRLDFGVVGSRPW
jgi:hypothetical protein